MPYPTAGVNGLVKLSSTAVANLQKWAINAKGNVAKTTAFQASGAWESNTATIRGYTVTADGWTDPSDSTGQALLLNGVNTTFTLELDVDSSHHWSGSAILTGLDPAADAQNMNTVKFTFTGTGA